MADADLDLLTPYEATRQALHRAADRILHAWPHALTDANARGYPTTCGFDSQPGGSSDDTTVERAALRPDRAAGWIAELGDILIDLFGAARTRESLVPWSAHNAVRPLHDAVEELADDWALSRRSLRLNMQVRRIINLGNKAAAWWPPPPTRGRTLQGVTVGERGNTVENCGLCGDPVSGGHSDPIRRIDGQAFHGKSCWFTVQRQRKAIA